MIIPNIELHSATTNTRRECLASATRRIAGIVLTDLRRRATFYEFYDAACSFLDDCATKSASS